MSDYSEDVDALAAERVLIDTYEVLVLQKRLRGRAHLSGPNVRRNDQRRSPHRPERHLGALLRLGQSEIAENQHVGVVPRACTYEYVRRLEFSIH